MYTTPDQAVRLRVTESPGRDVGRALVRMDPADLTRLGVKVGDTVELIGKRRALGKAIPAHHELRGQGRVQIDGVIRDNAGVSLDELIEVRPITTSPAERVTLAPSTTTFRQRDMQYLSRLVDGLPVLAGNSVRVSLFGSRTTDFTIESTVPKGPVLLTPRTELVIGEGKRPEKPRTHSYEDIGGLGRQVQRIREMIELPLRYPEVFERLGIDPPKGVLLHGPPGCGKTLIARSIAHETEANFFSVNGPEIIHKFYGESEAHLRRIFEEASRKGPSIIFIDEIDAIAPPRERAVGEVEKRVVAQLLALMDGLNRRTNVIVIAATNLPNSVDPALRRPGRFDREIAIPIPDRNGRQQILEIHTRGMPLGSDVDLVRLAEGSHGFVGADLEALCREAAMSSLRRILDAIDLTGGSLPYERLLALEVNMADFSAARNEVEPSALREVFVEVPSVSWDDVGGLEDIKKQLIEAVQWPLKHPELFRAAGVEPVKGILLDGPPGCGKTLLAKAAASQCEVNFLTVKGPELLSKYIGDSERAVRETFHKARQAAPCIIFFDEIDALLPRRSGTSADSHVAERVLGQFLVEMDGIEELAGVLVLGATNRADMLDPALVRPGRFDTVIRLPLPDKASRMQIFAVHLRGKPLRQQPDLDRLAQASEGLSGAEIASICHGAARRALRRILRGATPPQSATVMVEVEDLDTLLQELIYQKGRAS